MRKTSQKQQDVATHSSRMQPLRRTNLVDEAVEQLEAEILKKRYGPGDFLPPESRLGQTLGVSRTVVREAMRILVARGLVEVSQGRPARVRPIDASHAVRALGTFLQRGEHSLLNLTEVRRPLESEIAALAAKHATAEHIAAMVAANEQLHAATTMDGSVEADIRFHDVLAQATGNPVFGLLLRTLSDLMRQSRQETLARTGKQTALDGHRKVLDAVRRVDAVAAREAMLEHLAGAERDLRKQSDRN